MDHKGQERTSDPMDAEEIDLELLAKLFSGYIQERPAPGDAGVVDHGEKARASTGDPIPSGLCVDIAADIQGDGHNVRQPAQGFQVFLAAGAPVNTEPTLGQEFGRGPPDA